MDFNKILKSILAALKSQRGHNLLVFLVFLAISTILWWVLAMNDEDQSDVRMPIRITNVPDSVTIISTVPENIAVSLRTHGSTLMKLNWGRVPALEIDFRAYRHANSLRLSDADLKALVRQKFEGANIIVVSPDTLNLLYTTHPGVRVPIVADYEVTAGARSTISSKPKLSADSANVFSINGGGRYKDIITEPIRIEGINKDVTKRVRLIPPKGTRVIPDSIDVTFTVEPLIYKTRRVALHAINTPSDVKLITFPAQIDVNYLIPVSRYKVSEPVIRLAVDYKTIDMSKCSKLLPVKILEVSNDLRNVQLSVDSVEYIIEKR